MCLRDDVPECLRPDSEGLESGMSMSKIGNGRKLTFCTDGEVRPCCGATFHCHDVNACWQHAQLGVHKYRIAARKTLISKVMRKQWEVREPLTTRCICSGLERSHRSDDGSSRWCYASHDDGSEVQRE